MFDPQRMTLPPFGRPRGVERKREVQQGSILVVDDDEIILVALAETLRVEGYEVTTTQWPTEALKHLKEKTFAVIISDQRMNEMTGLEFLSEAAQIQPEASRILITGVLTLKTVIEAINTGEIYRFIAKPWLREELLATIRNAVQRHNLMSTNKRLQEDTLGLNEQLARANADLEQKIAELTAQKEELARAKEVLQQSFDHSLSLVYRIVSTYNPALGAEAKGVADLCARIAEAGCLNAEEQRVLKVAGWLHNIGLIGVPRNLHTKALERPDELTEEECAQIQRYPVYGQMLAGFIDNMEAVGATIRASQERWDGRGYPDGLQGESIPLPARFLSIAIYFVRALAIGLSRESAMEEVLQLGGEAFDPEAVQVFLPLARAVELSRRVRSISPSELRPGMVLARGIYSPTGLLLVAEGQAIDHKSLKRICEQPMNEPLQVYV